MPAPAPVPSHPSCLSPAWQPHKSLSLSASSQPPLQGTEPRPAVYLPEIHGDSWGLATHSLGPITPTPRAHKGVPQPGQSLAEAHPRPHPG